MAQKLRKYFFTGPQTTSGKLFRTNNRPNEQAFRDLLDSVAFHQEQSSEGSETQRGLFKRANISDIKARSVANKAVMPHQLPIMGIKIDDENQASEISDLGIGIYKEYDSKGREYNFFRLRGDTLPTREAFDEQFTYVMATITNEVKWKDRTVKIPINKLLGNNNGSVDYVDLVCLDKALVYDPDGTNKMRFELRLNGERYPLTSDNDAQLYVGVTKGVTYQKTYSEGLLVILITGVSINNSSVSVNYTGEINGANYMRNDYGSILLQENSQTYSMVIEPTREVHLDASNTQVDLTLKVLNKDSQAVAFAKSYVTISKAQLPDSVTIEHTTNSSNTQHTLRFKYNPASNTNPGGIGKSNASVRIEVQSPDYDLEKSVDVFITAEYIKRKIVFVPDSLEFIEDINSPNGNSQYETKYGVLAYYEDDEHTQIAPDLVDFFPDKGTTLGQIVQADDGKSLKVPVVRAADKSILNAKMVNFTDVTATLGISHATSPISNIHWKIKPESLTQNIKDESITWEFECYAGDEKVKLSQLQHGSMFTVSPSNDVDVESGFSNDNFVVTVKAAPNQGENYVGVYFAGKIGSVQEYKSFPLTIINESSIANYKYTRNPDGVVTIGGENNPNPNKVEIMLMKNNTSVPFDITLEGIAGNGLPDTWTYKIKSGNSNNTMQIIEFTIPEDEKVDKGSNPEIFQFHFNMKEKATNEIVLHGVALIKNGAEDDKIELKFQPNTVTIVTNGEDSNNQNIDTRFGVLKYFINGVESNLSPESIYINRNSAHYGIQDPVQYGKAVKIPIEWAADGALLSASLSSHPNIFSELTINQQVESGGGIGIGIGWELYLTDSVLGVPSNNLGVEKVALSTVYTDVYLKDAANNVSDLLEDELVVNSFAGCTVTKTTQTDAKGYKFVRVALATYGTTAEDKGVITFNLSKDNTELSTVKVVTVLRTRDGKKFAIDAQGSVAPTGADYIDQEINFAYLDESAGKLYFKTNAVNIDPSTWSAGIDFGKGDPGEQGPPATIQWINGTQLKINDEDPVELKGQDGEKGEKAIPHDATVDPTTYKLSLVYKDDQNQDVVVETDISVRGPIGQGEKGDAPEHQWTGTSVTFRNPDNSWGDSVDLKGDKGDKPNHEWSGTEVRFENPDGSFGAFVDVKGEKGDINVPDSIEVDLATGKLIMNYVDSNGDDVQLVSSNQVVGPPGASVKGDKGEDGRPINWRGSFANAPADPEWNDAYYDTVLKQSRVFKTNGTWGLMAKDGETPVDSWPNSVATVEDLDSIPNITLKDVGRDVYVVELQSKATLHSYNATTRSKVWKYAKALDATPNQDGNRTE